MTIFAAIATNLKKLSIQSDKIIADVLKEKRELIEQLNREQLQKGKRADGVFNPLYSDNPTQRARSRVGKPIRLFMEGDYYKQLKARVKPKFLVIENTNEKDDLLTSQYGEEIKGLSTESVGTLQRAMFNKLQSEIVKFIRDV